MRKLSAEHAATENDERILFRDRHEGNVGRLTAGVFLLGKPAVAAVHGCGTGIVHGRSIF